jgi:NAD(P)-dependent dehydrogenase (short-subunit alcohol dehydrogenase family)
MRWIVTGANRGIGLELVRQLAKRGDTVEAGARQPAEATELGEIARASGGRVHVHPCDVTSDASVKAFAAAVSGAVDVLVNNAGVMGKMQSLEALDLSDTLKTFDANTLGPIRVTRAFLPHLQGTKTRRIVHITSGMGSIADNTSGGAYGYRMSKAALNMANKSMSIDLAPKGFVCVVMNPGWVKTDMGGSGAPTPVEESAAKMIAIIDGLSPEQNGAFLNYRGGTFPY